MRTDCISSVCQILILEHCFPVQSVRKSFNSNEQAQSSCVLQHRAVCMQCHSAAFVAMAIRCSGSNQSQQRLRCNSGGMPPKSRSKRVSLPVSWKQKNRLISELWLQERCSLLHTPFCSMLTDLAQAQRLVESSQHWFPWSCQVKGCFSRRALLSKTCSTCSSPSVQGCSRVVHV